MKKQYIAPAFRLQQVHPATDIITSSIYYSNDPADGGEALARERSGASWSDYEQ